METARALIDSWIAEDAAVAARRASLRLVKATAAPTPVPLRFVWNGMKGPDGVLQPARFSFTRGWNNPDGTTRAPHITIYHRDHCGHFKGAVREAFSVRNGTDSQSDYFECDRIDVETTHTLWPAVAEATIKMLEHDVRRLEKLLPKRPHLKRDLDIYRDSVAAVRALLK